MTTPALTKVTHEVLVNVPLHEAFDVFTTRFGDFKPREHNLLAAPIVEPVVEPRVGGHIIDRAADGSECRWARILAFEPPHGITFSWDISPNWTIESDPEKTSEVEVKFEPDGDSATLVTLEHRLLHRHGPGWESERDAIAGPGGWPLYLAAYTELTNPTRP